MKGFQMCVFLFVVATTIGGALAAPSDTEVEAPTVSKARGATGNYWLSNFAATLAEARQYCTSIRLQLLIVKNNVKQAEIAGLYRTKWASGAPNWIWLNAQRYDGVFEWGDFTPVAYNNFVISSPCGMPSTGDCAVFAGPNGVDGGAAYAWNQISCSSMGYFVCEDKD